MLAGVVLKKELFLTRLIKWSEKVVVGMELLHLWVLRSANVVLRSVPDVSKKFPIDCLINGNGDRSFLDLQRVATNQLIHSQILAKNILSSEECTKCNPDKYFSYRRSGEKAGRMISVIGLT